MYVDIDGIRVNYIDEGNGTNVLLLHGWGASLETMLPIFNLLKHKCRVVAVDLPGFGESDLPKTAWSSFDYTEFITKLINKLNLSNTIIFGHSHGGRVASLLAAQHPELVKKLVLIDSAGIKPKRSIKYYFKVYKYKLLKVIYTCLFPRNSNDNRLESFYKKYGSTDYKNTNGIMRQTIVKVLNDNIEPYLGKIDVPVLVIWGENDADTPLYMAKKINRGIANSGLVTLANAGHYSYLDNFMTFRAVVESFLANDFC